mgnify:CR=1 FL=1
MKKSLITLVCMFSAVPSVAQDFDFNEVTYLPQQTDVQRDFPASVREIVMSGFQGKCGLRPFYTQAEKREAELGMERMGISELAAECYRNLSGGQQQRVLQNLWQ